MNNLSKTGAQMIAAERKRQIEKEGYTSEHDRHHVEGELTYGAICYANPNRNYIKKRDQSTLAKVPTVTLNNGPEGPGEYHMMPASFWPWRPEDWKPCPGNRMRELQKAGAMIAAEIDRLRRQHAETLCNIAANIPAEELEPFNPKRMIDGAVAVTGGRRIAWNNEDSKYFAPPIKLDILTDIEKMEIKTIAYNDDGQAVHDDKPENEIIGIIPDKYLLLG